MTGVKACAAANPAIEFPVVPGYRVLRLVGAGGMGSVFEAVKLATRECFAVKVVSMQLGADPARVLRFQREVKALRDIRHPNVVEIYDWCLPPRGSPERPYIVMELLQGETLAELLRREKVLAPARAVALMLQMLDGLAQAHRVGVLHRDLGPSNVFVVRRPERRLRIKLIDFGLARPILGDDSGGSLTQPGTFLGKPAYAAPEVFLEQPLGPASDVFSAGMVLYRMLTGRLPHAAVSGEMLWVERFSDRCSLVEYPSPREFAPDLPEALADVVARSLRKRARERIATAKEFQRLLLAVDLSLADEASTAALQRFAQGVDDDSASAARPTASALERLAAPPRSGWLGFLVAGLGIAALIATALIVAGTLTGPAPLPAETPESAVRAPAPGGDVAAAAGSAAEPSRGAFPAATGVPAAPAAPAFGDAPGTALESGADGAGTAAAATPVVRIRLEGLPPGAVGRVGEWPVDADGQALVPRADRPLDVIVDVPSEKYLPFVGVVVPDRDRVLRPDLPRATATGAAASDASRRRPRGDSRAAADRPQTLEGSAGGVFVLTYD